MGGDEENQSLLDALNELPDTEEKQGFDIAEADLGSPGEFGAPLEPMPQKAEMPFSSDGAEASDNLAGSDAGDLPDPGENADPALAVDEMLSAASVFPEAHLADELLPLDSSPTPTFQLYLQIADSSQKEKLKALATSMDLSFSDGDTPIISQLNEFQALSFRQAAMALGVGVKVVVNFPLPTLSEDEQALGELAAVQDDSQTLSEGAPSVILPKNEKGVMLLPADSPTVHLVESLGLVTAHRSIARRFFREEEARERLEKELLRVPGRNNGQLPASRLEGLFRELFLDLQKASLSRGGNAVMGIRLEAFPESSNLDPALEQLRLVAFGTAAVVEKP